MTAEQLLEYRREPYRHELIDGILHEVEPPGAEHGVVVGVIQLLLGSHVRAQQLGTTFAGDSGFLLASDPDTVRAPDVAFVASDRIGDAGIPRSYWRGPPDLAVEVVSPNDRHSEVEAKALDWLGAGTRAVLVVDPSRRTATVYRARDEIRALYADESLDLGDVVPGWAPLVGELFA